MKSAIEASHVCWIDLAAADARLAGSFYGALFGWQGREERLPGGGYIRLASGEADVASIYQLSPRHLANGVPSHWTPYVAVADVDEAVSLAASLDARVIVAPHRSAGDVRVCLIQDPVGALIGLWQQAR